ncbi:hypothetical protein FS837_002196 [Tulasnella sp. UAMH 9824]|nr:hypothetical protein FS837_002196 [Tulasnella sp. UAMH 9824]
MSMQDLALQAVREFELLWPRAFPIRKDDVKSVMEPIQQYLVARQRATAEQVDVETTVDGSDSEPEDMDDASMNDNEEPETDEDGRMSEEEYRPDLEAPKRVTRGTTKAMKHISSVKILSGPLPKASTTKRRAIADEAQAEDESSGADSGQAREHISRCRTESMPEIQITAASSSRKRKARAHQPKTGKAPSAGGKAGASTKKVRHTGPPSTDPAPERQPKGNNYILVHLQDALTKANEEKNLNYVLDFFVNAWRIV